MKKETAVMNDTVLFNSIMSRLPDEPSGDGRNRFQFWSDGMEILTADEDAHKQLVEFFDSIRIDVCTGYYDPAEDKRDNSVDDHTGNYYINLE